MGSQLQMPCLGRAFQLGMLYDCHTEQLISGGSLWDAQKISQTKMVTPLPKSHEYQVIEEDSLQDKCSSLGIEDDLKLSLMSGMVDVKGAAEFWGDRKSSERQCRVTLLCKLITHFELLARDELGDVENPDLLLSNPDATHIVTGLVYGSNTFFVFDRFLKDGEQLDEVCSKVISAIKVIPVLQTVISLN